MSLRFNLVRTNAVGLALRGTSVLAGFAIGAVLARLLGPSGYGIYAAAFALMSLVAVPLQLGLPTLVLRNVTLYIHREEWGLLRGILSWARWVIVALSLVIAALALVAHLFGVVWSPTTIWAAALAPLLAWNRVRESALQGFKRIALAQVPDQVVTPFAYLICLVVISVAGHKPLQPQTAMATYVLCALAGAVFGTFLLVRFAPRGMRRAAAQFRGAEWLQSILPLSLISGFGIVNGQIDVLLLSALSTPENTGFYRIAFTVAAMALLVGSTVGNLMSTHYAEFHARGDQERLQKLVRFSAWAAFIPSVCVLLVFVFGGATLLGLAFGPQFAAAKTTVVILCIGQTVNCAGGVVQPVLNMTGHANGTLKGLSAGAATNILLALILVPRFGAVGAAIATTIGIVVQNVIHCAFAWRRIHINTTVLPIWRGAVQLPNPLVTKR